MYADFIRFDTRMKKYEGKSVPTPPNKQTRNLGVYAEDLELYDKAVEATMRNRAGMFRWIVSEWKAGRAVFAPVSPRQQAQFKRRALA